MASPSMEGFFAHFSNGKCASWQNVVRYFLEHPERLERLLDMLVKLEDKVVDPLYRGSEAEKDRILTLYHERLDRINAESNAQIRYDKQVELENWLESQRQKYAKTNIGKNVILFLMLPSCTTFNHLCNDQWIYDARGN